MPNPTSSFHSLPQEEQNLMHNQQIVERAKGPLVWMEGESEPYIDFVMGYSAANFGHLNDDIIGAFSDATADNVVFFASRAKVDLTQELGQLLGLEGDWCFYFPVGGTMGVEAAARACLLAKPSGVLLSLTGAFHGYSGVSRALTDDSFLRNDVFMATAPVIKSPRPMDVGSIEAALVQLDENLAQHHVAGVFVEPVQGAAGFIDLGAEFLRGVHEVCTKHEVPLVIDEIQSAMYRCGALAVSLERSVVPDILLLGKSLGGGLAPISAVIMRGQLTERVPLDRAAFDSTFSGWSIGVASARRVIRLIKENNFAQIVQETGAYIDQLLDETLGGTPLRSQFRRIGMAVAYDGQDAREAEKLRRHVLQQHLIVQTAGMDGSKCKLSPPITISRETLAQGIRIFAQAAKEVTNAEYVQALSVS